MQMKPLSDRVLVEVLGENKEEERLVGDIILPTGVTAGPQENEQGVVVAVGPGAFVNGRVQPMTLKVGDKVLLPQFGGIGSVGSTTLYRSDEILALIED